MSKFKWLFLIAVCVITFAACGSDTVTLHCDGENCDNTVEVKVKKENTPDESWIIFCADCEEKVLSD